MPGPTDSGLSSLSTSARMRREGALQFAARKHAEIDEWRCLGPGVTQFGCRKKLTPHQSGRFFFCSDECRQAALDLERAAELRRIERERVKAAKQAPQGSML